MGMQRHWIWLCAGLFFFVVHAGRSAEAATGKPNVLFIAIDDQNDWIGAFGGHPLAKTPQLDSLASRGTAFLNAHCQSPLCNPSRTSLMLSLRPSTTGVCGLSPWFRAVPALRDRVTLAQHFMANGYKTYTTGKIYHGNPGGPAKRAVEFDVWGPNGGFGPKPPQKLIPPTPMGNHPLMDWGVFPHREEDKGDHINTSWAIEQLQAAPKDEAMFLAVGYYLPHVPCHITQRWYDLFPDDDSVLPKILRNDRDDTPRFSWYLHWSLPEPRLKWVEENHQWRNLCRSYLACTSFVDAQIGRLLEALRASGRWDNTVIVVWGDNGWHLGEKAITGKNTLWNEGTRVPLIFVGPGVKGGQRCMQPAELLDIYPTLVDLCGLPKRDDLEGISLMPQLKDAQTKRVRPAISTHNTGNHAIRSERYRYIHYADGSEEFYDVQNDPDERTNLAAYGRDGDRPSLAPAGGTTSVSSAERQRASDLIAEHRKWLPKPDVLPAPGSAARVLVYDATKDEAVWEDTTVIHRSDPIP